MTITAKIAAALLAIFVVLLASMAVILNASVLPGFRKLELEAHSRDVARVQANLDAMTRDLQTRTLDYAQWDDTYNYLAGAFPGYIAGNFLDNWFSDYDVDLLAFYDDAGRLTWTRSRAADGAVDERRALAGEALASAPAQRIPGNAAPSVIWTADGPMLVIVAPATQSDGGGEPRGAVVMGKRISLDALRDQTQIEIDLLRPDSADPVIAENIRALTHLSVLKWQTADESHALVALRSGRGALSAIVAMERPRDVLALGKQTIGAALVLLAALAALGILALGFVVRQMVIARVLRLEKHLNAQSSAQDMKPLAVTGGDELSRLTEAYNALAARVRDANARAQGAELERQAAAKANRMKSDFLANISHELRTPLNAVIGYTELVQEDLQADGVHSADDDLMRIAGAGRHLLSLVNEILDLSKIEAGKLEVTPGTFTVGELITSVVDSVRPLARQNGNQLTVTADPDLGSAYSDEMRLRQSLINIMSNACKFTANGEVSLDVRRLHEPGGDVLRFTIRDTGVGMTEDQLARVFEPFVQADASISRRFGGTGLGLAITRKIVTLLGGEIEASSTLGRGSTFVVTAPAVLCPDELRAAVIAAAPSLVA